MEFRATTHPALASVCAVIPAREPAALLPALVAGLRSAGFGAVLVVDDGSSPATQPLFAHAEAAGATLLRHAVNLGKGRALKTAFNAVLAGMPSIAAVVTADADGQHTLDDIVRIGHRIAVTRSSVIGGRAFDGAVPLRSRFGNAVTRLIFASATGVKLDDTQSGLRGLPRAVLPGLLLLEGERYEYEMNMLAHLCRIGACPEQVPIATVYIEANRSSHFSPIRDSMRIYFVLARFVASSIVAAALDLALFALTFALSGSIALAVACGRISSLVNFTLNRRFVFRSHGRLGRALAAYYALALAVAASSFAVISILAHRFRWNLLAAKILVDAALSLVSFCVQRTFIFRRPFVRG